MTEEEKKAIAKLEQDAYNVIFADMCTLNDEFENIDTVLKLVQKQQEEIENIKQYWQWSLEDLQEYHKIASDLKYECTGLIYKLEKKDKIIDEMAEHIRVLEENVEGYSGLAKQIEQDYRHQTIF